MNTPEQSLEPSPGNTEKDAPEGFLDVSSQNILDTLPNEQRNLINKHRELFERLNQAKNAEKRSEIFEEQRKVHGFSPQESEQRKVYDLVVKLKDEYR
jgi:hypothetical protein